MTALFPLRPPPRSVARAGFLSSLSLSVPICRMRITALRMGPVWIVRCCWTVVLIWGGPAPGDTGLGLWTSVVVTTRGAPGIEWVGAREAAQPHSARAASRRPETRPAPNAHRAEGRPRCLVSCLARTGASRHVSRLSVCLWTTASLLFPRTQLRDRCTPFPGLGASYTLRGHRSSAAWAPQPPERMHPVARSCPALQGLPPAAALQRGHSAPWLSSPSSFLPQEQSSRRSAHAVISVFLSEVSIILSLLGAVTGASCALTTSRSIL